MSLGQTKTERDQTNEHTLASVPTSRRLHLDVFGFFRHEINPERFHAVRIYQCRRKTAKQEEERRANSHASTERLLLLALVRISSPSSRCWHDVHEERVPQTRRWYDV